MGLLESRALENEMVDHLIASRDEFTGYRRDAGWHDTAEKRVVPDRVLTCDGRPLVGLEISELLPLGVRGGSDLKRAAELWGGVYREHCRLRSGHPELCDTTIHFSGLKYIHPKSENRRLAEEIMALMLETAPEVKGQELVTLSSSDLSGFPLLSSVVDQVRIMRAEHPGWFPPYAENLPADWILEAIRDGLRRKRSKIRSYRNAIRGRYPDVTEAEVHLLLWCRNECPPNIPAIEIWPSVIKSVEAAMADSGFDAIWYINGIRNNSTNVLNDPQKLYPKPQPRVLDSLLELGLA